MYFVSQTFVREFACSFGFLSYAPGVWDRWNKCSPARCSGASTSRFKTNMNPTAGRRVVWKQARCRAEALPRHQQSSCEWTYTWSVGQRPFYKSFRENLTGLKCLENIYDCHRVHRGICLMTLKCKCICKWYYGLYIMSVKRAISLDFVVTPSPYSPTTEYVCKHTSILSEGRKFVLNISGDSTFHASEPLNNTKTLLC